MVEANGDIMSLNTGVSNLSGISGSGFRTSISGPFQIGSKYAALVSVCLFAGFAIAEQPPATNQAPSVKEILDTVLAQMPGEPMLITGRLGVHDRGQSVLRSYQVEIRFHIAGSSLSGSYTLFDSYGSSLEQFRVSRQAGQKPHYEYAAGNPLRAAAVPDVFSSIRDTGVTWSDLSLPFLWWRNGVLAGSDSVRGRDCFVLDVQPTAAEVEARQVVTVRVWIDKKYRMLLQAEEYGAGGKMLRRLSVQSFKKINDEWMIKDIVVAGSTNLPSGYKSYLTIKDMRSLGAPRQDGETVAEPDTSATAF